MLAQIAYQAKDFDQLISDGENLLSSETKLESADGDTRYLS
jgi:hypothetical protein